MSRPEKDDEWAESTDSGASASSDAASGEDENAFPSQSTQISSPTGARARPQAAVIPLASRDPRLAKLQSLQLGGPSPAPKARGGARASAGPQMQRVNVPWGGLSALIIAGGLVWVVAPVVRQKLASSTRPQTPAAATLQIATVEKSTRSETSLNAAGYIAAADPLTIGSTVGGRVKSVPVVNGQAVKKGALLVQLDDSEVKAQLGRAEVVLKEAKRTYSRYHDLVKAEAITILQLEQARSAVELARAEVTVLYPQLKALRIVAPTDATVVDVLAAEGEVLTPSTAGSTVGVVKLADLTKLVMEADVNESDISLVRRGDRAEVTVESVGDKKYDGRVRELAVQTDKAKGTVTVKITLPPDPRLRPGMSAKVHFQGSANAPERILIPKGAVSGNQVWVVEGGAVHRRAIHAQSAGTNVVEVTDGLKVGEQIVAAGGEGLFDGKPLK
jgi:membrane fusion protein (multidrug efflux system)